MIVCDHCRRYATSACRSCIYFSDIYANIKGEYYVEQVTPEEADHELRELYPEDFHGKFATKLILAYRFVSRVLLPFLLYEKWNRSRQYIKGAYYPWEHQTPSDNQKPSDDANLPF